MDTELSIVCPYRDRADLLSDFVAHITSKYPAAEVIVMEQGDSRRFLRGQLLNLGFQHSTGKLVLFTDIDLRFTKIVDFSDVMNKFQRPYYPYTKIEHCLFSGRNAYTPIVGSRPWINSPGGMYVYSRDQFLAVNGHSNLFLGHSYEDTDLRERANPVRFENTILHLKHKPVSVKTDINRNATVYSLRSKRDPALDGVRQTIATVAAETGLGNNARKITATNIGVCADFAYKKLLADTING